MPQAGPKREVTVQVPRGKANTVQGRFSTSAAEQAFQSARAFSRHVREGHSAAQAAVGAPLSIHDISLSLAHVRKQTLF